MILYGFVINEAFSVVFVEETRNVRSDTTSPQSHQGSVSGASHVASQAAFSEYY